MRNQQIKIHPQNLYRQQDGLILEGIKIKSRQLDILLYLLEVKKTNYQELVDRFEISKRTAIRDINALSAMGIPVYTQSGYHGGIFLPEEYTFRKSFFTPQEISSLVLALHISSSIHHEELEQSILQKLELLTPDLVFVKEQNYKDRVKVKLLKEPIATSPSIWKVIDQALDHKKWLQITIYNNEYHVEPLYYVICQKGLLLQCSDGKKEFSFPVIDMTSCELSELSAQKKI